MIDGWHVAGALGVVLFIILAIAGVAVWLRRNSRTKTLSDTAADLARRNEAATEKAAEEGVRLATEAAEAGLEAAHAKAEGEVNRDGSLADHLNSSR